jgi:PAS domain S-box-containing protein
VTILLLLLEACGYAVAIPALSPGCLATGVVLTFLFAATVILTLRLGYVLPRRIKQSTREAGKAAAESDFAHDKLHGTFSEFTATGTSLEPEAVSQSKVVVDLQRANEQLETRISEDMRELTAANERLQHELDEHKRDLDALHRWEQFFKHAGWGVATLDATDNTLLTLNPAFAEMHGLRAEELVGQPLENLVAASSRQDFKKHMAAAAETRHYIYETRHVRRGESDFPVQAGMTTVIDNSGAVLYRAANFQDISSFRRVEQSLQLAKEELEKATRTKAQFLSRMSHELRTPLNVILGFSQLLEMNITEPEHRDSIENILKASKHLLSLINEVLDISRIDAEKVSLSLQVVPIGESVLSAISLVRPMGLRRQIEFVDQVNTGIVKYVIADNQRLQQVFLNLISNAVKYNKQGGRVTVWCSERADKKIAVNVTDTGSGIPQEKIPRLFAPFERLDAEEEGIEGTGLGLALAKRLVELMDGTLEVSSVPGEGSTFSVILPVALQPLEHPG